MRQKQEICKYCGEKMEPKTTRQEFCSDKCRVYWNRENPKIRLKDLTQPTNVAKPPEQPKTNYSINTVPEEKKLEIDREAVLKQIAEIRAEKIPKERDTPMGRKSWAIDQQKRIKELEKKLQRD